LVGLIHPKAMPVILTTPAEIETWMGATLCAAPAWSITPMPNLKRLWPH
jgi:hypothetical protein